MDTQCLNSDDFSEEVLSILMYIEEENRGKALRGGTGTRLGRNQPLDKKTASRQWQDSVHVISAYIIQNEEQKIHGRGRFLGSRG